MSESEIKKRLDSYTLIGLRFEDKTQMASVTPERLQEMAKDPNSHCDYVKRHHVDEILEDMKKDLAYIPGGEQWEKDKQGYSPFTKEIFYQTDLREWFTKFKKWLMI